MCIRDRTITWDSAVVLLNIIGYLYRIILHCNIEVVEADDKEEIKYCINHEMCIRDRYYPFLFIYIISF